MNTIEVFDTPTCCASKGQRSPLDSTLGQFAADLDWLAEQGVEVLRHSLTHEPEPFALNPVVAEAMDEADHPDKLNHILPIVFVDGQEFCAGRYPSRIELTEAFGQTIPLPAVKPVPENQCEGGCGGNCHDDH